MNNYTFKKQQGMTAISLVLLLAGIFSIVLLVLKIIPVYIDHGKIVSALEGLKGTGNIETLSRPEIQSSFFKKLSVNPVESFKDSDLIITKMGDYVKVEAKYQVEVALISNISALMKFDDFIEAGKKE
jgi:hypothetical protein